ncbi:sulfite reductase (NADPH) hemoprotein beta-component [Rhodobium orientis]|uniref:Sulfite reductase n=1 Tax=Rhodobium orientis TaxID=34017 RepID=A0A327JJR5_9HYPH|nr:nitrite/sulfite reductase [Rhodobium orientis]MBB4305196.1 sulfite reductase (NADPH) hemoprotein beta-component [Rhodobium orientis]MBK5948701.1 sulfite reductase [Rhodobium orientis]RAI26680.1 sulfite reductase [Rhodobium orientis]
MYVYDDFDAAFVKARVAQFRDQVNRRLSGELTEEQFKPLRLMNGVYLQLHGYMLRVAIPYGVLNSAQMRMLAHVARRYDRGYGHFTTRQNIQYNWPKLVEIPDLLDDLARVEMHAIQTSGNCIRNTTADPFAGAAADEFVDPRPYAEIIRQWSSLHPEFSFLPRKFKVAITGATVDRAAIKVHDIGLKALRGADGEVGFEVFVGGGQGRTPMIAKKVRDFLPEEDLLSYLEAILRVYNLHGRRDNKYKARIKILVHETGTEELKAEIEAEWERIREGALKLPKADVARIAAFFAPAGLAERPDAASKLATERASDAGFDAWVSRNVVAHKVEGYGIATISLKAVGEIPGDASAEQMEAVADLAERFGHDDIRVTHEQNLVLPHVGLDDLKAVYDALVEAGLASANAGLISDIIACPGLDYCALANTRSIPIATRIAERFADAERQRLIGDMKIKISGCINACGHHHVGHIGILGVEKKGQEFYQITLGGSAGDETSIGAVAGRGFSEDAVIDAVEGLVDFYLTERRDAGETFLQTYRRLGPEPFKGVLYGAQ